MKNFLLITGLLLAGFSTQAQSVTNLAFRVTVEVVTAGVTNSTQSSIRLDDGVKRDKYLLNGALHGYAQYLATGGTNSLEKFLQQDIKDRLAEYGKVKAALDNQTTAQKITTLLTLNPDLLSSADLNNLATIAAKAP